MADQIELDGIYMGTAFLHAMLSKATRAKVGAVLVTEQGVTLTGFNGTPTGRPNECEYEVHYVQDEFPTMLTKEEVIHAELNCIMKAAREGISCINASVYVTLSPCVRCSAMLIQAGVKRVVYFDTYRNTEGIELLKDAGIIVENYSMQHK
jgi:dCMP deaminase